MIDPNNITNFYRTTPQLQEFLLFCVCVAGKNAKVQAKKLEQWSVPQYGSPFRQIGETIDLEQDLRVYKFGKYKTLVPCFMQLADSGIDLKTCTREELIKFPGIGMKTASLFLLHTRRRAEVAYLDTHILKWLSQYHAETPKVSPQSLKQYLKYERFFLNLVWILFPNCTYAEIDLHIWRNYAT